MKTVNKSTMFNALEDMRKAIEPNPYNVTGFKFLEDVGEDVDHRRNMIRLGFLESSKQSEAYHKANQASEYDYVGDDYLQFIEENPEQLSHTVS